MKNNWIGQVSKQTLSWRITMKTVNSFRRHGNFANGVMGDQKADKKTFNARTAGWMKHTQVVFIFGATCCNLVWVCLRMSTNVFIWMKHGNHRWFEQIRIPNFQDYPPILCPPVCNSPWRDKHATKYVQLIRNAQWFLSFSTSTFVFPKTTIILWRKMCILRVVFAIWEN